MKFGNLRACPGLYRGCFTFTFISTFNSIDRALQDVATVGHKDFIKTLG
jgi:hypothetical protein